MRSCSVVVGPARSVRDDVLASQIERVWNDNLQVYGARKVWRQLEREGIGAARCTVERLTRRCGPRGVFPGKAVRTTLSNPATPCPHDLVNRQCKADRPNQGRGDPPPYAVED